MHTVVSHLWLVLDRIADLFHAPFWKVVGATVIATLSIFAFLASSGAARDKPKSPH